METCKYGLGASTRKPPTARWVWRWVLSPHNEEQDVKKTIMYLKAYKNKVVKSDIKESVYNCIINCYNCFC